MPTVLDATVVARADDTSGNGGRKLVNLSNGWKVAVTKATDYFYFSVDKQDGGGFVPLCHIFEAGIDTNDVAIESIGNNVHVLGGRYFSPSYATFAWVINAETQTNVNIWNTARVTVDSSQTALGNMSIIKNSLGTELHATWASKNATYPNSFNIRYAKGTINADGSVTGWVVEQVTGKNVASVDLGSPSLTFDSNGAVVIMSIYNNNYTYALGKNASFATVGGLPATLNGWRASLIDQSNYAQSSPSAIFVPQSVNGLANGRIWVAWHGLDATDSTFNNIRTSYSDDGGATWSAMQKITPSGQSKHQREPSITANKNNEIFIVWHGSVSTIYYDIRKVKYSSGAWGSITNVKNGGTVDLFYPSTLYDPTFNFTEPLFIYKDGTTKVGFYGTWTVTTISVTQGSIGQKTDKANVLTYAITTDGVMSTITEKVNGVTVGTKTATSGQSQIVGLSQAQWDAVINGKYKDVTGGLNTLTIQMGSETFTYTFDKRPATDADMISVAKAVQDSANVYIPAIKKKLVDKVGGNVANSFETIIDGISLGKKKATGTITSAPSTTSIINASGNATNTNYVAFNMANLPFIPGYIEFVRTDKTSNLVGGVWRKKDYYINGAAYANANVGNNTYQFRIPYANSVLNIAVIDTSTSYDWTAYEE